MRNALNARLRATVALIAIVAVVAPSPMAVAQNRAPAASAASGPREADAI